MKYIIIALALVFANCATNNSLPVNGGVTKDDGSSQWKDQKWRYSSKNQRKLSERIIYLTKLSL